MHSVMCRAERAALCLGWSDVHSALAGTCIALMVLSMPISAVLFLGKHLLCHTSGDAGPASPATDCLGMSPSS